MQTVAGPEIDPRAGATVTALVVKHPAALVYVIVVVPTDTPVTTPDDDMVAIVISADDQAPPVRALVSVIVPDTTSKLPPPIAGGLLFMVITTVLRQPFEIVYVMLELPAAIALIVPVNESIVATEALLDVQTPSGTELLIVVAVPTHKLVVPAIDAGAGSTVSVLFVEQPVDNV